MILHIPHASRLIPADVRRTMLLTDAELDLELTRMTDAFTDEFFLPAADSGERLPRFGAFKDKPRRAVSALATAAAPVTGPIRALVLRFER